MLLQYRAAAVAGLWTQIFFGLVLIMIYEAFYRSSSADVQPLTPAQIATYVWLGQALLAMQPWQADAEIREMVRSGAVVYELCRPIDLYTLWYVRALAGRTAPTVLRAAPMAIFATLVLPAIGLDEWRLVPPGLGAGLAFAVSITAALALSCAITVLMNLSLLWTISGEGIVMITSTLVMLCSGMLVALPLFPDRVRVVLERLPFAGIADLPFRVFTGAIPTTELATVLARQLGWTVALVALGRWLLGRGVRRLVVQGG